MLEFSSLALLPPEILLLHSFAYCFPVPLEYTHEDMDFGSVFTAV